MPGIQSATYFELLKRAWPVILGFVILYAPTFYHVATTIWTTEDQAHGPIIVLVVAYLVWVRKDEIFSQVSGTKQPFLGWLIFIAGILQYILGQSQSILILSLGSLIAVLIGLLLIFDGFRAIRILWFPLFFLVFLIPLPGAIVDSITMPMKIAVSYVAEYILYALSYPIARSGVILHIGQYQLLVADACAGLHTLISLEALGLLYLNIVRSTSFFRNITLALLIIPISFTANVIRVMVLTLITYYFGDAVGQGFMHGFAGMFLFVVALILIIWVDSLLQYGEDFFKKRSIEPINEEHTSL